MKAEKPGFERTVQGPINLFVDAHPRVDFQLSVGEQTTTVTVQSTATILDSQTATVGTTVEQAKVAQLPYNGRNYLETMLFTPGVVPGAQGSELNNNRGGSINVNGLRENMNGFLLDGMSDTSIAVGIFTPHLRSIQFRNSRWRPASLTRSSECPRGLRSTLLQSLERTDYTARFMNTCATTI
jgi:hypothetical protein